jgi:hypothetical protein
MSNKAEKLLNDMRRSQANWSRNDILSLYVMFGFEVRNGAKHDVIKHPEHPDLRTTLPRHRKLAKAYVRIAVDLVDKLKSR